ncbi:MAG: DUF2225 domain-containing protein, partial [Pusillimonas sp.]
CDTEFTGEIVMSSNNFGGIDHDLCPHAMGASPLSSYIWGCPECNFCGYSDSFKKSLKDEDKEKLLTWLKSNYPKTHNSDRNVFNVLPTSKRYEIAAELAKFNNETNYNIAKLYLRGAWAVRHAGMADADSGESLSLRMSSSESAFFEEEFRKAAGKKLPTNNRAREFSDLILAVANNLRTLNMPQDIALPTYFIIASQLRAMGENSIAEEFLKKAETIEGKEKFEKYFDAMRHSFKIESELQKKTIKYFLASLDDKEAEPRVVEATFLLGELNRRIGNFDEAEKYYLKLFDYPHTPQLFFETVVYGLKYMNREDSFPVDKAEKFEKQRIEESLARLLNPFEGREAAHFLHYSKHRDLIFPKLVELIKTGDEDTVRLAFMAMSDETQEAIDFQLDYLKNGKNPKIVLSSLIKLAHKLPSKPFIELFEAEDFKRQVVEFLRVIADKSAVDALIGKAEAEVTLEKIRDLSELKNRNYEEEQYHGSLLLAIATLRDLRAVKIITTALDIAMELENKGYGNRLADAAGTALEILFNRHFGFSSAYNRSREPKELKSAGTPNNRTKEAYEGFKKWYSANQNKALDVLVLEGYEALGYKITATNDADTIKELVQGLNDSFRPLRVNSCKELIKRVGVSFRADVALDPFATPREYQEVIALYNVWLEENIEKFKIKE